jgi:aspartate/glutamate racemase
MCGISDRLIHLPKAVMARIEAGRTPGIICSRTCRSDGLYAPDGALYPHDQNVVDDLIERAMHGDLEAAPLLDCLIGRLRERGAQVIVLGCTELAIFRPPDGWPDDVIDSAEVAAQLVIDSTQEA